MSDSTPWLVHAEALLDRRRLSTALACFDMAERKGEDPDRCAAGRWMAWMLQGDFEKAWQESDAIRCRGALDPHRFWNGESMRGNRVMVRCLHGLGDAVQFLRYVPALRRIAARVIVETPPRLIDLAPMVDGVDEAITWGDSAPSQAPDWDVQIEVTELPCLFRTRLRDLPFATNYIRIPDHLRRNAMKALGRDARMQVGVVWSSGEWNPARSMPIQDMQSIFQRPDITFWNLQGGPAREQWNEIDSPATLRDAPAFCADRGLVPLAAFISQLDLVITVDTLAAHLAGALGRPAWLMLQNSADWRWMTGREDSPWYPSMRIFRQAQQGDWASISVQVDHALAEWNATNHARIAA